MPLFDLPLEALRRYEGTNPRPNDFDAYWEAGLRELDQVALQPELIPSRLLHAKSAECFDLRFTGVGHARVYAKYLRPKNSPGRHPTVLLFHGYSASSGDWADKLAFVSQGFCVAAMDCRGQGGWSEDAGRVKGTTLNGHIIRGLDDPDPTRLLYRSIFLDTAALARVVSAFPEVDPDRLFTLGASQGGALALACAALEPRIRRTVSVYPFLCDYERVWNLDLARDAYDELRHFFRRHDPRHERRAEIFTKLGYIDCQHLAPRIRAEVRLFTGLSDTICPPSTQFAAYNKLTAPKDVIIYPDFGHENLPGQTDLTLNFFSERV